MFEKIKYIFKKWLGMTISYRTEQIPQNIQTLRTKLEEKLKPTLNQDIINKKDGRIARISGIGVDKISSSKALAKSLKNGFTKEEHFKAGENIKELYEFAVLKGSFSDKNKSLDIVAIHRYSVFFQINSKDADARLTLKESVEHGNRIYSLELDELKPLLQAQAHTKQVQQGQSNLTKDRDVVAKSTLPTIEETVKTNPTTNKQTSQALPAKHKKFSQMNEAEKESFLKERTQFATDWNQIQSEFLNSSKEINKNSTKISNNTLKSTQSPKPKIKTMFGKKNNKNGGN